MTARHSSEMPSPTTTSTVLTLEDVEDINAVQYELGYILDEVAYDRLTEVYADDVAFHNPTGLNVNGVQDLIRQSKAIAQPAVSHQVTNVIVTPDALGRARVVSRAITVRADRSLAFSEATDQMEKRDGRWKIVERRIRLLSGSALNQY